MKPNIVLKTIFLFISFHSHLLIAAPPYAINVKTLFNFDQLLPTPLSQSPTSDQYFDYFDDLSYGRAGWVEKAKINGSQNKFYIYDASARHVWSNFQYAQISNAEAVRGNSFQQVITGGVRDETTNEACGSTPLLNKSNLLALVSAGVNPVCSETSYFVGEGYAYFNTTDDSPFEAAQGSNRMSIYIKTPNYFSIGGDSDSFPQRNLNIGPYSTIAGGHFYHYYYLESGGGWIHLMIDTHPTHNNTFNMDGHPGYDQSYIEGIFSFYARAWNEAPNALGWQGSGIAPYSIYYDEIEFYNDPEPQNDQTINSPGIAYSSSAKVFNMSFNDKYWNFDSPATYQIKYSFSPITNLNYNAAKPVSITYDKRFGGIASNSEGLVSKTSNYRNMLWAPFTLKIEDQDKISSQERIYFAIKDLSNRDYSNVNYDKVADLSLTNVAGIGNVKEVDLIKRIDFQFPLTTSTAPIPYFILKK